MAELLVTAVDHNMPTLTEWKSWMTDVAIPAAEAYPYPKADLIAADALIKDVGQYRAVRDNRNTIIMDASLKAHVAEKEKVTAIVVSGVVRNDLLSAETVKLNNIRSKFLSSSTLLSLEQPIVDLDIGVSSGDFIEAVKIKTQATHIHYHDNILNVEASKSDAVKSAELAEKDQRGCHKRGDTIVVKEDDHAWGKEETLPNFIIIKIKLRSVADCEKYLQPRFDGDGETILTRKLYTIRLDDLPPPYSGDVATGVATVPWEAFRGFIQNKVTLNDESGVV